MLQYQRSLSGDMIFISEIIRSFFGALEICSNDGGNDFD